MAYKRFSARILRSVLGDKTFLESGLVGFDPVSRTPVDGLQFPEEWPSSATPLSLSYTLPELLEKEDVSESIVLNIRRLVNNDRFAPVLDLLQTNCLENDRMSEVNEFWKASKDQHKYVDEFGYASKSQSFGNWKNRFGSDWKIKKNNYETKSKSCRQDFFDPRSSFTSQFRPSLLTLNTYFKEKEMMSIAQANASFWMSMFTARS
ncbi:hypothetical protein Peur_053089 [Populus x canadensis]